MPDPSGMSITEPISADERHEVEVQTVEVLAEIAVRSIEAVAILLLILLVAPPLAILVVVVGVPLLITAVVVGVLALPVVLFRVLRARRGHHVSHLTARLHRHVRERTA
jgi:hypothetical protein